jgi:tRNA(Ile)-lysidine synthase
MGDQHTDPGPAAGGVRAGLATAWRRLDLDLPVLVAASGGLDSTVLAHGLAGLLGAEAVVLGHVHHGLRGAEADADAAAVAALAGGLGCRHEQRRIAPHALREGATSRERLTLQEAARAGRYAALEAMAEVAGAATIATAHHADDQAETVLLRILRGTGPDGLGGIPERSGRIVRPLLRLRRADLEAYAEAQGLAWREDASNASPAYTRNRLRREWLPRLAESFNPNLLRTLANLAEAQRTDADWIAEQVAGECSRRFSVEGSWLRIDAKDFRSLHEALARRIARELLVRGGAGRHVSRTHLLRVVEFLSRRGPGRILELPGGIRIERDRVGFRLGPLPGSTGGCGAAC